MANIQFFVGQPLFLENLKKNKKKLWTPRENVKNKTTDETQTNLYYPLNSWRLKG